MQIGALMHRDVISHNFFSKTLKINTKSPKDELAVPNKSIVEIWKLPNYQTSLHGFKTRQE